jgi:hypothetical protein
MSESRPLSDFGETVHVDLNSVIPYWRNPRRVTDEAVNMLAESIKQYGYQQPIVVDEKMTIIIGHTRYAAMRRLGVESADILIVSNLSPARVKQLRIIDNRAAEYTSWDFDALFDEVAELDAELMTRFFPDVQAFTNVDDEPKPEPSWNIEGPIELPEGMGADTEFICPSCYHSWETHVTREQIFSGQIGETP